MKRENVLQEVRQMRIQELYARRQQRTVTVAETAEILGVTEWRFRQWGMRYDAERAERRQDRRLGHPSRRFLSQHTVRILWYGRPNRAPPAPTTSEKPTPVPLCEGHGAGGLIL